MGIESEGAASGLATGDFGTASRLREATQPLRRRGFRFMEADMHEHIWSLAQVWENEPALAPMRKAKVVISS